MLRPTSGGMSNREVLVAKKRQVSGEFTKGLQGGESSRRGFLKGAAGMAAGMIATTRGGVANPSLLPTVMLGSHRVTRLIVGSNPIYGYSHFNRQYSLHMMEWFTDERLVQFLLDCENGGINTWQASYSTRMQVQFPKIRDKGCTIQWVCLASGGHLDEKFPHTPEGVAEGTIKCAEEAAKFKPLGVAFHGSDTDRLYRAGKIELIKTFVDRVHDLGLLAGISTHNPAILETLEEKGWSNDYYMTAFHYQTRSREEFQKDFGIVPVGETYLASDPPKMCKVIRQVRKPCLVYKILAAGRRCDSPQDVRAAFAFAYKNIKPIDAAIVGMYPRYSDQIAEDAGLARELCAG
jgi:hypothetical protein